MTGMTHKPPDGRWQQGTVFAVAMLFLFMVINFADKAVLGLTAVPMMQDLGLSPSQFGFIGSAFFFLYAVSAVGVGFAANRMQTKWVLMGMVAIWSLAQFPIAWPGAGFGTVLAARIILGAAEGPANPVANHALYKFFPNEKRNFPASIVSQGTSVGVILGVPLLGWVITSVSWRAAYVVLGVVGLVWMLVWAMYGREGTETIGRPGQPDAGAVRVPYRRLFFNRTFLGVSLSGFGVYWGLALVIAWFPAYLQAGLGLPPRQVYSFAMLPWLLSPPVVMTASALAQRWMVRGVSSRAARGVLSALGMLAGGGLLLSLPLVGAPWARIAVISLGTTLPYIILTLGPAIVGEIAPVSQRGGALAVMTAIMTSAGVIAPWIMGFIIEGAATPAEGYVTGFVICGAIAIAAGVIALLMIHPEATIARLGATAMAGSAPTGRDNPAIATFADPGA